MLLQIVLLKLSEYFSSIFKLITSSHPALSNFLYYQSTQFLQLQKLKLVCASWTQSAGGPDGVSPIFLKSCQQSLSPYLAHLFSLSYTYSYLPPSSRLAYITPIFKKGDPACDSNYLPIFLTSTICKLMESIIKDNLFSSLLAAGRISKHQHAFITKTFHYNESTRTYLRLDSITW